MDTQQQSTEVANISPGFGNMQSFELSFRVAKLLSQSSLVPKEYQDNIPNCVIALNMAGRMNADPLMVMQNLYIVYGRPGWSSQFLISTFNSCGRFSALRYEWQGEQGSDDWGCRAWAIEKGTKEKIVGSLVTISLAKKEGWHGKSGSKWQTMPEQMMMYRAASFFIRTYAPELAMGIPPEDEIIDITPGAGGAYEYKVEQEIITKANAEEIDVDTETGEILDKPKEKDTQKEGPDKAEQQEIIDGPGF